MGESVKILDVARQMIALSGLHEGRDIEIVFTGLLQGEKLYEEVQHLNEELSETSHERILRLVATPSEATKSVDEIREVLDSIAAGASADVYKEAIQSFVPEYSPSK